MPLAFNNRPRTDPRICRNFSWSRRCWNSNPSNQTSCSFNCLCFPVEISGPIHDTVRNCHSLRLSSGLRVSLDGGWPTPLIPSKGSEGSRSGIRRMVVQAAPAATDAMLRATSLNIGAPSGPVANETSTVKNRTKQTNIEIEHAFGRLNATKIDAVA